MARKQLCAFGKEINHALVELNQPKEWLIEQVGKSTGRYFDRSYLHKIQVGEIATPGIVQAIREILDLPESDARSDRLSFFPKLSLLVEMIIKGYQRRCPIKRTYPMMWEMHTNWKSS